MTVLRLLLSIAAEKPLSCTCYCTCYTGLEFLLEDLLY